jgi:hypothetical protein
VVIVPTPLTSIQRSPWKGNSPKFGCRVRGLARQRPIVSHGGHHLNDGRTARLRVAPIVEK